MTAETRLVLAGIYKPVVVLSTGAWLAEVINCWIKNAHHF
ncbi:hypothetical protein HMPREF0492_1378 [Lactobacillus acidophilus ATCC 4796]|nr:hypothetical protein HMPREF0492_1378 [Lactobacillus acidophilus ATCC 4796]